MAKLTRYLQKLFASTAGVVELKKFGSLAAGTPANAANPEEVQELSQFLGGWFDSVIGNNSAAIEDRNSLDFLWAYQLAYMFQAGISEWETGTEYHEGSFCQVNGLVYKSLTDTNTGNNPVGDSTNWRQLSFGNVRVIAAITFGFAPGDVTVADDEITETAHTLETGDKFQLTSSGTLPAGLSLVTDYWAIKIDVNTFAVANSLANAISGTKVTITDQGSGTHTLTSENEWNILDDDGFKSFYVSSGTVEHTLNLPESGNNKGRDVDIFNQPTDSNGFVTLDGDGSEEISGETTRKINTSLSIQTEGINWFIKNNDEPNGEVRLDVGNGLGGSSSGETRVRNINHTGTIGDGLTYTARTTTTGSYITANYDSLVNISYSDGGLAGGVRYGITINSKGASDPNGSGADETSTSLGSGTLSRTKLTGVNHAGGLEMNTSRTIRLNAGDRIRCMAGGASSPMTSSVALIATEVRRF